MEKMEEEFQKLNCDDGKEAALPLVMDHLTPALLKEAREKLNEKDDVKQKALSELRSMIEAEKRLYVPTEDLFLLAFLRARKFHVKKAFKLFQNYWKFRRDYDKLLSAVDFDHGVAILERSFIGLLEKRDKNGCAVFVAKFGQWNPSLDNYDNVFRMLTAILVYSQEHEATQIAGFRAIIDIRGVTWTQMKYCTPANGLLLIRSTQFCYPARYKGVHVLCESKWIKFIWAMLYPLLTSKLKQRIYFHSDNLAPLRQYIDPSVLPEEFGGEAPPFKNNLLLESLRNPKTKVLDQLKYGYKD